MKRGMAGGRKEAGRQEIMQASIKSVSSTFYQIKQKKAAMHGSTTTKNA